MRTNNKQKAFVRFDGTGRIIPGSLIVQSIKPKVGNWKEINANECCSTLPNNTNNSYVENDYVENYFI